MSQDKLTGLLKSISSSPDLYVLYKIKCIKWTLRHDYQSLKSITNFVNSSIPLVLKRQLRFSFTQLLSSYLHEGGTLNFNFYIRLVIFTIKITQYKYIRYYLHKCLYRCIIYSLQSLNSYNEFNK